MILLSVKSAIGRHNFHLRASQLQSYLKLYLLTSLFPKVVKGYDQDPEIRPENVVKILIAVSRVGTVTFDALVIVWTVFTTCQRGRQEF